MGVRWPPLRGPGPGAVWLLPHPIEPVGAGAPKTIEGAVALHGGLRPPRPPFQRTPSAPSLVGTCSDLKDVQRNAEQVVGGGNNLVILRFTPMLGHLHWACIAQQCKGFPYIAR